LHLGEGCGRGIERGIRRNLAAELSGQAEANVADEHGGGIRAVLLWENSKIPSPFQSVKQ